MRAVIYRFEKEQLLKNLRYYTEAPNVTSFVIGEGFLEDKGIYNFGGHVLRTTDRGRQFRRFNWFQKASTTRREVKIANLHRRNLNVNDYYSLKTRVCQA